MPRKVTQAAGTIKVSADLVESWWQQATKKRPIPDRLACEGLAWKIAMSLNILRTAPTNKRSREYPIIDALTTIASRIPIARDYWETHKSEPLRDDALKYLAQLQSFLVPWASEFLREDMVTVEFVAWESATRTIYPIAAAALELARGTRVADPHRECPVCAFIACALTHAGFRKGNSTAISPAAVAMFLLRSSGLEMPSHRKMRSRTSADVD